LVIVIVILIMIIKAMAGGGDKASPKGTPSPKTATAVAAPSESATAAVACTDKQLTGGALADGADILLTKDQAGYGPGVAVTLKAQVKNISDKDCQILNNPHIVVLSVVSGTDRIFDSADCAAAVPEDAGDPILVKAGETADIPISWDASRSQQGCPEVAEKPFRAKDATYVASVTIAGVTSDQTQFLLTP
jgi:hypothetical protein